MRAAVERGSGPAGISDALSAAHQHRQHGSLQPGTTAVGAAMTACKDVAWSATADAGQGGRSMAAIGGAAAAAAHSHTSLNSHLRLGAPRKEYAVSSRHTCVCQGRQGHRRHQGAAIPLARQVPASCGRSRGPTARQRRHRLAASCSPASAAHALLMHCCLCLPLPALPCPALLSPLTPGAGP
jgi:hypothetical protein